MRSPRSSSSNRRRIAALGLVLALSAGCRLTIGGAEEAQEAAFESAADSARFHCGPGPVVAPTGRDSISFVVERLLTAGDDLLLVTRDGALLRFEGRDRTPARLLDGGRDYDSRGDVVVRLRGEQADFFRYEGAGLTPIEPSLPAARHDLSVALTPNSLYLHSPVSPANVLVVHRDRRPGGRATAFLPVDRSLLRLLMGDIDGIMEDTGYVRALDEGFAFVPMIRDPIEVVARRPTAVFLSGDVRGMIRTVSQEITRDEHPCRTCTQHREIETRQEVRRLYADAARGPGALWILRLDPPGSSEAILYRYCLRDDQPEARSWRMTGMQRPPRAMAIWKDRIVVADEGHLNFYDVPRAEEGGFCQVIRKGES